MAVSIAVIIIRRGSPGGGRGWRGTHPGREDSLGLMTIFPMVAPLRVSPTHLGA